MTRSAVPPSQRIDVTALGLAIDWHARRAIQAELTRIGSTSDFGSKEGLALALSATVLALRRAEVSWVYAGAANFAPTAPADAQRAFIQVTYTMRARYQKERIRGTADTRDIRPAEPLARDPKDGEGLVMVTLVVAARRELLDLRDIRDASQMRAALNGLGSLGADGLVAFEAIWSPADENDRMSSLELEAIYPEMQRIDPRSVVGRVQCAYCQGLFAAELLVCPHCGAPGPKKV